MLYLLDANVLIDAHRDYYRMESVPQFWEWLIEIMSAHRAKLTMEIYDEVIRGNDELSMWVKNNKRFLLFGEPVRTDLVQQVVEQYFGADFDDEEMSILGVDPFLIASALIDIHERVVVTSEKSKPSAKRANRKIPDVCYDLGVRCIDPFEFYRELDFRTVRRN